MWDLFVVVDIQGVYDQWVVVEVFQYVGVDGILCVFVWCVVVFEEQEFGVYQVNVFCVECDGFDCLCGQVDVGGDFYCVVVMCVGG